MVIWRTADNWTYETFYPDTHLDEFGPFASIIQIWRSKCAGKELPCWSDFELSDFSEWYGWLTVMDLHFEEQLEVTFRLWGTRVAELAGFDITGKRISFSGADNSNGFDEDERDHIIELSEKKLIGR